MLSLFLAIFLLSCPFHSVAEEMMTLSSEPAVKKPDEASPNAFIESMLPSAPDKPFLAEASRSKGEDIVIPKEAMENKDISFLEGCWVSEWKKASEWSNRVHFMSQDRLCFDRKGNGSFTVTAKQGKNDVFRGKAKARFSGAKIVIKTGTARGRTGTWTPSTLELEGSGKSSMCYFVAVNPSNPRDVRRTHYRLFRD